MSDQSAETDAPLFKEATLDTLKTLLEQLPTAVNGLSVDQIVNMVENFRPTKIEDAYAQRSYIATILGVLNDAHPDMPAMTL